MKYLFIALFSFSLLAAAPKGKLGPRHAPTHGEPGWGGPVKR